MKLLIAALLVSLISLTSAEKSEKLAESKPLYLHCIGVNPNGDGSTIRLLTTRVIASEIVEVYLDSPAMVSSLTGTVDCQEGEFTMEMTGVVNGTKGDFSGAVAIDTRCYPMFYVDSPVINFFAFVLSHGKNPKSLLGKPFFDVMKGDSRTSDPSDQKSKTRDDLGSDPLNKKK